MLWQRSAMSLDLASAMGTAGRLAAIASDNSSANERAEAILQELKSLIPLEAAEIIALNPFAASTHESSTVLANFGYSDKVLDNLHSEEFFEIMNFLDLPSHGRPVRMKDLPGDPLDNWAVSDVLLPAGYREGMTMCLRTSDGRFVGVINLSTTDNAHPSDLARDVLFQLCTALGNMADPLRSRSWVHALLGSSASAIGLDKEGTAIELPGILSHTLLQGDTELLAAARKSALMGSWSTFVWPNDDDFLRVRVLPCTAEVPITTLVSLDAIDIGPFTHRELEVLTLAAEGLSNGEIGEALVITSRTVATHVEHILDKINAPNRAAAASFALREGLILGKVDRRDLGSN
jgi:DNA-binding CsgD family transcriptional regulator